MITGRASGLWARLFLAGTLALTACAASQTYPPGPQGPPLAWHTFNAQ